jgi:hypothetical protein
MVLVIPVSGRPKGRPPRTFLWRVAHKFSIYAPPSVGAGYGAVLGIAAQANRGTDARALFDNQMVMWKAIVLAPHGLFWFLFLLVVWLVVVLWTGQKAEQREKAIRPAAPAIQQRKQAEMPGHSVRLQGRAKAIQKVGGDRDTSIAEALGWAIHAMWGAPIRGPILSIPPIDFEPHIERLRQAALAGDVRVWGRRGDPHGLIELIDREFWKDNTLDEQPLRAILGTARTIPFEGVEKDERFYGIMVNRNEIERLWPHAG